MIKNRRSAKKSREKRKEKRTSLQAEYDRLVLFEADAAIELRCLEIGIEELKKSLAQNQRDAEELGKKPRIQKLNI